MSQPKYSIVKIIPYFGSWPEWIELFIESCKYNSDIDWLIYTNCPPPENRAENVRIVSISFEKYISLVSKKLGINFQPNDAYKLCDLKPALGHIHADDISNYDFYAFGDIDVIYGDLRYFLTDDLLNKYEVIGTHDLRLSGHFCLFRNTYRNREAFRKIKNWRTHLENSSHLSLDESKFSKIFLPHRKHPRWLRKIWSLSCEYQRKVLFREQYSTILSPIPWKDGREDHPQYWFWHKGHLSNDRDECEFMYLHFMNWKSSRWLPKSLRSEAPAWSSLQKVLNVEWKSACQNGFQISANGFTVISKQSI